MNRKNQKAQQIIEYLLVAGAVITALLLFTRTGGPFRESVRRVLNLSVEQVNREIERACVGEDCAPSCGNGTCDQMAGETCENCEEDCGKCPTCGNGICEPGELTTCPEDCDFELLCPNGVCDPGEDFMSCPWDCPVPLCGNGQIDGDEDCDSGEFIGGSPKFREDDQCSNYGDFYEDCGSLSCNSRSAGEWEQCTVNTVNCCYCGNNKIEAAGNERCDGWELGGATCASELGQPESRGTLVCNETCDGFDTSGCFFCGDGQINAAAGEKCDPGDGTGPAVFGAGVACPYGDNEHLICTADCEVDDSQCEYCGDGEVNGPEECDGSLPAGMSSACSEYSENYDCGNLACVSCHIDTTSCLWCGDGTRNCSEECDKDDWGGETCESQGFDGGDLACYPEGDADECTFDFSNCSGCGDGICTDEEKSWCEQDCGCWYVYGHASAWSACGGEACLPAGALDRCDFISYNLSSSNFGSLDYIACGCLGNERPNPEGVFEDILKEAEMAGPGSSEWDFMQADLYNVEPPEGLEEGEPYYVCAPFTAKPFEPVPCCGDGVVQTAEGEECEPAHDGYPHDLNGKRCPDFGLADKAPPGTYLDCYGLDDYDENTGASLACKFNTENCPDSVCGNGRYDEGQEDCDATSTEPLPSCASLGLGPGVVLCYGPGAEIAGNSVECTFNTSYCGLYPNGECDCIEWDAGVCVLGEAAEPWKYPQDCPCTVEISTLEDCSVCGGGYCENKDATGRVPWVTSNMPCEIVKYPDQTQRCSCIIGAGKKPSGPKTGSDVLGDCESGVYKRGTYRMLRGYACVDTAGNANPYPDGCCGDTVRIDPEECEGDDLGGVEVCGDLPKYPPEDQGILACYPAKKLDGPEAECTYDETACGRYCRSKDELATWCDEEGNHNATEQNQGVEYFDYEERSACSGVPCGAWCPDIDFMKAETNGCLCQEPRPHWDGQECKPPDWDCHYQGGPGGRYQVEAQYHDGYPYYEPGGDTFHNVKFVWNGTTYFSSTNENNLTRTIYASDGYCYRKDGDYRDWYPLPWELIFYDYEICRRKGENFGSDHCDYDY